MLTIGYAFCGSFCTFEKSVKQLEALCKQGYNVIPIMSPAAHSTDTRFGKAEDFRQKISDITGNGIISEISEAEPIGPKKLLDALVVAPCTGNTLSKLAHGITDTCVTLAVKAHLRNRRPVVIAVSTNDALASSAKNIGFLLNLKNYYFVPMRQDDYVNKPNSVVADFTKIPETLKAALKGEQIQPVLIS